MCETLFWLAFSRWVLLSTALLSVSRTDLVVPFSGPDLESELVSLARMIQPDARTGCPLSVVLLAIPTKRVFTGPSLAASNPNEVQESA